MTMTEERAHAIAERVRKEGGCSEVGQALVVLDAAVPRWIDVNEEVPPDRQPVLTLVRGGHICISQRDHFGYYRASHWMPLPAAPEVGR